MPTLTDRELAREVAACYADPLRFVLFAYPWPVKGETGPAPWQREVLIELGRQVAERKFDGRVAVPPIRMAFSTGHGVGKSALFAWVIGWAMSTRPNLHGTVTANTNDQLEFKTWAAVREWMALCATRHWFEINSQILYRKGERPAWFVTPQSCAEENSESFAGQHAKDSTSLYIFDEASAVPGAIHEVAEGGLTDGEPIFLMGGNATRNTGKFYENVFGRFRNRWKTWIIDSRTVEFHNKQLVAEWLEDYGEDSDFFRVRVRGLPPLADELQFIPADLVSKAQFRQTVSVLPDEPLVCGVDVSGGGSAWTVARFRRGHDARSWAPVRLSGEASRDRGVIVTALAEILDTSYDGHKVAAMFVDAAFGAAVVERLHALGYREQVHEVNFGGISPDPHQANQRAYQWKRMKDWLTHGIIPKDDARLATDLCAPGFHLDKKARTVLEPKDKMVGRGCASPDDGDALSLTFARAVKIAQRAAFPQGSFPIGVNNGPMGWASMILIAVCPSLLYSALHAISTWGSGFAW